MPFFGIVGSQILTLQAYLKRFIKLYDKPVLEILSHAATVANRITRDTLALYINVNMRTLVESIHNNIRLTAFREGELHQHGAVGRSQLRRHVVVSQIDIIIIRCSRLSLVRVP